MPDFVPPDREKYQDFNLWTRFLRKLRSLAGKIVVRPIVVYENPATITSPDNLSVGQTTTILGQNFGANPGSVRLRSRSGNLLDVELPVIQWTNTQIIVDVPTSIQGIGFNYLARLTVSTEAAGADSKNVTVHPDKKIFINEKHHDWVGDFSLNPNHRHEKTYELTSDRLPTTNFILQDFGDPGSAHNRGCVSLSPEFESTPADSPGTMQIDTAPEVMGDIGYQHAKVRIRVFDDFIWKYRFTVKFIIWIPVGIDPPAGWSGPF